MLVDPIFNTLNKLRLIESSNNLINEAWGDLSLDEKQALDNLIKNKIMPRAEKEPELGMLIDRYNALKKDAEPDVSTDKPDPVKVKKFQELIDKAKKGGQDPQPHRPEPNRPEPNKPEPPEPEKPEPEVNPVADPERVKIIVGSLNQALQSENKDLIIKAFSKLKSAEEWQAVQIAYGEKYKPKVLRDILRKRTEKADREKINYFLRKLSVPSEGLV